MRKISITLILLTVIALIAISLVKRATYYPPRVSDLKKKYTKIRRKVVDHTKFKILNQQFKRPQDVTLACISCHTERHKEVMEYSHWNWERPIYLHDKGIRYLGKRNAINNFCIGVQGNEQSCAKCHIGYGMAEKDFSYRDSSRIDCLVCHDNTATYNKGGNLSGYPDPSLNLTDLATHVGKPTRDNCGICHFFGGGGNNVKHGDLEKSMFHPDKEVDIHMADTEANLVCTDCHVTKNHKISGTLYSIASENVNRVHCSDCHSNRPHDREILNEHTLKVACQTCHIPIYAKVNSTNIFWDWSTAGKLKNGEPFMEEDSLGNHIYKSIKGSFTWGRNLRPDYIWFNGTADHYLLGDKIKDPSKPLILNKLNGSYKDANSKIIPVKIHRAIQIYDPINKTLIQPLLYTTQKGTGAFWKDFDWQKASEKGMKRVNLPYSGKYDFTETVMYWPINHMVSPKEEVVQCTECHTRTNSRLAGLTDFYMPGRDYIPFIDTGGLTLIVLSLLGVFVHGSIRIYTSRKNRKRG